MLLINSSKSTAELCKKLQKKIEFNLGQRFGPLDCEKNIESIIQLLKANNLYEDILILLIFLNRASMYFSITFLNNSIHINLAYRTF